MQRLAGNRVVAGLIHPGTAGHAGPPVVQRALSDADHDALAQRLHGAMDRWGTDEEAIYVALQKLNKDPAAVAKLKDTYKKKFSQDLESDIRSEMSGTELALALELLGAGGSAVNAAPASDADYKASAKRLHAAMKPAGTDEEGVYAVLIPLGRDPVKTAKLSTTYSTELSGGLTGAGLEADLKDEMSAEELSYALYLLNAPAPRSPGASGVVTAPGTEDHAGKVPGGSVSVRTGVEYDPAEGGAKRTGAFSVGYEGALAADTGWIQFIWSEMVRTAGDGSSSLVAQAGLPTSNGPMSLTTDLTKPERKIDTKQGSASPFYESGFRNVRTPTGTVVLDRPQEFDDVILRQFDAGATKVVERDHFDQFLVQDNQTIYHTTVVVEWVYTSKTASTKSSKGGGPGKAVGMPSEFRNVMVAAFPKFEYIQ